MTKRKKTNSDL